MRGPIASVRRHPVLVVGVAIAVACGGGVAAYASTRPAGSRQVTAIVRRGSVTGTVEASGTVAANTSATASFPVSGTVARVAVTTGQRVRKGEVLARLDRTSLSADVDSVAATLAQARQQLAADRSGEPSTASTASQSASATSATATTTAAVTAERSGIVLTAAVTAGPPSGLAAIIARVRKDQGAVIAAQHTLDSERSKVAAAQQTLDDDVTANTSLRDAMVSACPSATTDPTDDTCTTAQANYAASADTVAADDTALDAALAAQATDVTAVEQASNTLDSDIANLITAAQQADSGSGSGGGSGSGSGSGQQPSGGGATSGGGTTTGGGATTGGSGSTSGTPSSGSSPTGGTTGSSSASSTSSGSTSTTQTASAADLAADEAAIDSDRAALRVAKQDLAAATLRSPLTGRVTSVSLSKGGDASSGSIVVSGTGDPTVSPSVPLSEVSLVHRGEHATVTVDGRQQALHGTVTAVGTKADTSSGSTTFPITVQLGAGSAKLVDGVGADVTITVGRASNVLLVPNSAITTGASGTHTVTVVSGSTTATVAVSLGVVGADATEVLSGLKAGQRVLLADASESLPASSTDSTTSFGPFLPQMVAK